MAIDSRPDDQRPRCGTPDALIKTRISRMPKKSGGERARNRYAADCEICGHSVSVGDGCIEKSKGRWVVFC